VELLRKELLMDKLRKALSSFNDHYPEHVFSSGAQIADILEEALQLLNEERIQKLSGHHQGTSDWIEHSKVMKSTIQLNVESKGERARIRFEERVRGVWLETWPDGVEVTEGEPFGGKVEIKSVNWIGAHRLRVECKPDTKYKLEFISKDE
jgi:hypothetical protein